MDTTVDRANDRLGPYELRGELGRGAMARVWRAWDPNLQVERAIKEPLFNSNLPQDVLDEMGRRFVAEGRAAARLNHPSIVAIHAADVYDGRPAIVMELVDGTTLAEILERGALTPRETLSVLDQLLDAVGHAHENGIVHRDIKPDNVFVTSRGVVKLADFGVAHVADSGATRATMVGTVLGTPGYMSPEQATGKPVDARSDLFSIGVVAYEMLSGVNPFNPDGADSTTLIYRIVHEEVPPLSDSAMAGIPADMRPAIYSALSKDPANRPRTAADFKAMLHGQEKTPAIGAKTQVLAETVEERRGKLPKWVPYIVVAAVAVVILIGVFVAANSGSGGGMGGSGVTATSQTASNEAASSISQTSQTPTGAQSESRAYLGIHDGYVAVFANGQSNPYRVTTIPISVLEPETAAKLGAGVECESLEDALDRVDTFIEKYEAEGNAEEQASKVEGNKSSQKEEKAPSASPVFSSYGASSVSTADDLEPYGPDMAVDKNKRTAWNTDGTRGDGAGEWIEFNGDKPQHVSGLRILPGFCKDQTAWMKNRRPRDITVSFDGGSMKSTIPDDFDQFFTITFDSPVDTRYVRITINSTYEPTYDGKRYDDCCISEIEFF